MENPMRYFVTLPFALAALTAVPVLAQDGAPVPAAPPAPVATDAVPSPAEAVQPQPVDATGVPATAEPGPAAPDTAPTPVPVPDPSAAAPATTPATPVATVAAPAPVAVAAPVAPKASLTAEQKVAYAAWPADTKLYFGNLPEARQSLFLRLADEDKAKLVALDASQQETVWVSLEKQDSEQKAKKAAKGK
jgi:hypothetical protein